MKSPVTQYDLELVTKARRLVEALRDHPALCRAMERVGLDARTLERGRALVAEAERAFEWERQGKAWNYISSTPERRVQEARYWYQDARMRWRQQCFRNAEAALATGGVGAWFKAAKCFLERYSFATARELRDEFGREINRARGEKPVDAPRPKDTAIVELAGWYEHWAIAARHAVRGNAEEVAQLGLVLGKAVARRMRGKVEAPAHATSRQHLDVLGE